MAKPAVEVAQRVLDQVPAKAALPIPCKLLDASLVDAQGRSASRAGVLYVVPPATLSLKVGNAKEYGASFKRTRGDAAEKVTATALAQGGCGHHVAWEYATADATHSTKAASVSFDVTPRRPEGPLLPQAFPFDTQRAAVLMCEGGGREFTIHTVCADQVEFEFATDKLTTPFRNQFKRDFNADSGEVDRVWKAETQGKLKISQGWKEDDKSHRACCVTALDVSLDPLFSFSHRFLLYGLPIPEAATDYIKAGVYFSVSVKAKFGTDLKLKKWADGGDWEYDGGTLGGSVTIKADLTCEATLLSPKVVKVTFGGETSAVGSFGLNSKANGLRASLGWKGVKLQIDIELLCWFDVSEEWDFFEKIEPMKKDFPIEWLYGPAPAAES